MTARTEYAAANGRTGSTRIPFREVATIVGVVFAATGALIVGMQWAISNNLGPLFLTMQSMDSQLLSIREDVDGLRVDVGILRGEVEQVRGDVGELRGEVEQVRGDVGELRGEVEQVRGEVGELRGQFADLRERVARVETGLELVQGNQVRIFDILERGPNPRE